MSNTTQQIRESLAEGKSMSMVQLIELNCWGSEDKKRASVAVCNMRSRGELTTFQNDEGVALHRLVNSSGKGTMPVRHDELENAKFQAEQNELFQRVQQVISEKPPEAVLDPGVTLVAAIIKTDDGAEQRVELTEGATAECATVPLETKDPGLFEVQRVTLADFVPAQPGVRLFLHRAGDVSIETVRSHFGQERVMVPKAHVRAVAKKLLEFVGEA